MGQPHGEGLAGSPPPHGDAERRGRCLSRASMTEVEPVLDFASSGRTGRRNALPDILGSPAGVSPSDLPLKLAEMSLSAGSSQEMQSPSTEVPPPQPQSPELKDTS
uniref:cAMP-dependent protein kinase inhibitor beta n=1 Tax=Anas platyrhynchos TaxID=8839 RepID=A0A8B9ZIS6_ANAPL